MSGENRTYRTSDYPLAEKHAEDVRTASGKALDELTLDAVIAGDVTLDDLRITARALKDQAGIARDAGRPTLAGNFERAAELVDVPQDFLLEIYELLRPGRAPERSALDAAAARLRTGYKAEKMAAFIEEAADAYQRRGLFR